MRVHLLQIRLLYLGSSRPENKNTNKNVNLDFTTQVKVVRTAQSLEKMMKGYVYKYIK